MQREEFGPKHPYCEGVGWTSNCPIWSASGNGPDLGWEVVMEQAKSYVAEMTQEISITIKQICSC